MAEYLFVEKYAEERGISITKYVCARSLNELPTIKKTPEEVAVYWELVSLANNLNKMSQQFNNAEINET